MTTKLSQADVAKMFRVMADLIEAGDSFEGTVRYSCIGLEGPNPDLQRDEYEVEAGYRVGNMDGQGGFRIV